jgi:uracil phosphoribosyltransferase
MKKNELITILRDRTISTVTFKRTSNALASIIAAEIKQELADWEDVILLPILRAGMALLPSFMEAFEEASVGFVGIHRDKQAQPNLYYEKLPQITPHTHIIILDPMVATGGSTLLTLNKLTNAGAAPSHITIVSMIGAPEGKEVIHSAYPEANLRLAILDDHLDEKKYIVPGLGDFGDRFFNT